ncbi:hypothetical protein [Acidithiobacillus sp.]|uniref:hypothetical protein n=1 Tax=Acidithiobacillus sp. TaxID=1872118 RepID=UPI002583C39B|nr:hypothetical protein [Acidithiobacillus sp.]MDD5375547.1 hypothetical protein [Acidithiobacillus sp.]
MSIDRDRRVAMVHAVMDPMGIRYWGSDEEALLSESALVEDWLKPEEDEAWAYLQPVK